jgi:anti-sigma factor RsiW
VSATSPSPSEIRDYLLRRLPESRRSRLEEAYFRDDTVLDQVEQAEDELVSDYVLGRLSASDRQRFEKSLLDSPYYRERVETTTRMRLQLARNISRRKEAGQATRFFRPGRTGLAVAASLFAILFLATLASALRLKSDLQGATRALTERAEAASVRQPTARPVILASGAAPQRVAASSEGALLLVLPRKLLPEGARSWRLFLRDGSRTAWESGPLSVGSGGDGYLSVWLPAGIPPPGRYDVVVLAEGEGGSPQSAASLEVVGEGS